MGLLFPPHINTVKNLEKNTKLPEILWVSPTLPPFCGLFITPNFQISGEIASQDFSSTLGIPGWCSRFPLLLLPPGVPGQPCRGFAAGSHPFSPVPPVPWRTWPRLLRNPAACSERCRPAGRPGALRQRGATGCPLRLGQEAEPLLRALQAPPARQARTRCPPHQRRSTPLLFPRVWREECEAERSAMSLCHSLLVFLLSSLYFPTLKFHPREYPFFCPLLPFSCVPFLPNLTSSFQMHLLIHPMPPALQASPAFTSSTRIHQSLPTFTKIT